MLGGATSGPPLHLVEFVASSRERIEAAKEQWRKADWRHGLFHLPPDDRDELFPCRTSEALRPVYGTAVRRSLDRFERVAAHAPQNQGKC